MYNILFVCYGNICRSPMAEMIFKDLIYKNNKRYMLYCQSMATSMEEIGNDIYYKAKDILKKNNVKIEKHIARQFKKEDYDKFDYIICFEKRNKIDLLKIVDDYDNKIYLLKDFDNSLNDIDDPWYSNDFLKAYDDINRGCLSLFNYLIEKGVKNEFKR